MNWRGRLHTWAAIRPASTPRAWPVGLTVAALVLLGISYLAPAVQAQTPPAAAPPAPSQPAQFAVRVIEASHQATAAQDPQLSAIAKELEHFKHEFNTFHIVRDQTLTLALNARGAVKLPDGQEFAITMLGLVPGQVERVRHKIEMPGTQSTRVIVYGGRTLDVLPAPTKATIVWTTLQPRR